MWQFSMIKAKAIHINSKKSLVPNALGMLSRYKKEQTVSLDDMNKQLKRYFRLKYSSQTSKD